MNKKLRLACILTNDYTSKDIHDRDFHGDGEYEYILHADRRRINATTIDPVLFGCKEYEYVRYDCDISNEELLEALRIIYTGMKQRDAFELIMDLDTVNDQLTPTKEMTLDEIEKQLGYKVKIVKEKKEE